MTARHASDNLRPGDAPRGAASPGRPDARQPAPRADTDSWWVLGALVRVVADAASAGGAYSVIEAQAGAGVSTPAHAHAHEVALYVLEGSVEIAHADAPGSSVHTPARLGPGQTLVIPAGVAHRFEALTPARLLAVFRPGGVEEFVRLAGVPARAGFLPPAPTDADLARARDAATRVGVRLVDPAPTAPAPAAPAAPSPAPAAGLFGPDDAASDATNASVGAERALVDAYVEVGRTLDDLPYTREFDALLARLSRDAIGQNAAPADPRDVFRRLQRLRKAARLPRVGRAASSPPRVTAEDEAALSALVVRAAGSLGQRDRLVYDPAFDAVVQEFNQRTGRSLTPHDVWRLVAKLAK